MSTLSKGCNIVYLTCITLLITSIDLPMNLQEFRRCCPASTTNAQVES